MDDARPFQLVHATCVAVEGKGVLLLGRSGAGKSDLALRLISQAYRVGGRMLRPELVADDQVVVSLDGNKLVASPPPRLAGKLEVRGLGIVEVQSVAEAEVRLAVELMGGGGIERYPESRQAMALLGIEVPLVKLAAFEASAPVKVLLAVAGTGSRMPPG